MANVLGELFGDIADAIREKTGGSDTMKPNEFPDKIAGIKTGSSADVCYVTFMSYDGAVEYGKKAVAVGDDCADPISRGLFDEPTRESTVESNFNFLGWSMKSGGAYSPSALSNVTEDRTVYAAHGAISRYYTISYYDGSVLLKSESLPYGATPSYTTTKENYIFRGWSPELAPVTGDANYVAVWTEAITFATGSWSNIIEIAELGAASQSFAVGDERTETLQYADGNTEEVTFVIASLAGTCDLADGGKDNMTIVAKHALSKKQQIHKSFSGDFTDCNLAAYLNGEFFNALPASLRSGIKSIYTLSNLSASSKCWIPSMRNLGVNTTEYSSGSMSAETFELFTTDASRIRTLGANGAATEYATRSFKNQGSYTYVGMISADGTISPNRSMFNATVAVVPAFCI